MILSDLKGLDFAPAQSDPHPPQNYPVDAPGWVRHWRISRTIDWGFVFEASDRFVWFDVNFK